MEELYRVDPRYTDFSPSTAKEAVKLFHKITDGWCAANWDFMPELMIRLARDLSGSQLDMFEQWIQNPTGVKPGAPCRLEDLHQVVEKRAGKQSTPSLLQVSDEKTPE